LILQARAKPSPVTFTLEMLVLGAREGVGNFTDW